MKLYFDFTPNPEEDELRQIPEIVLEQFAPDIFLSMMSVVYSVMNPIFMVLWQRYIETAYSIQIANYNLKDKQQGAWHHDQTADISVVVPLNTGDYKGGGTEFMGRGTIKPLPSGHALIFPSFTHMHRGLEVDKGDRYLLVFWLKTAIPV
jgi:predicted 2-oxoglutarate/Fe(II)-dependent dioxygenase YbiX